MKDSHLNIVDILPFLKNNQRSVESLLEADLTKEDINEIKSLLSSQIEFINALFTKLRKIGLFIADITNSRVYPNKLWYEMGYTDKDMLGSDFLQYIHPDDIEIVKKKSVKINNQYDSQNMAIYRIRAKDGSWRWVQSSTISIITDEEGNVKQYIGFDTDLTKEMEAKAKLEKALEVAKKARKRAELKALEATTIEEAGAILSSSIDLKTTLEAILDQAEKVIPFDTASIQILTKDKLKIIGGRGDSIHMKFLGQTFPVPGHNPNTKVIQTKKAIIIKDIVKNNIYFKVLSKDFKGRSWLGIPLIFRSKVIGMMTFDKNEADFFTKEHKRMGIAFGSHVANALENSRLYEELKEMAMTDPLTGAKNRRAFFEFAEQQENLYRRYNYDFSVIMLDIDFFKKINDRLGHQEGDIVLQNLVKNICQELRDTDILGRYGGEEFVILLPQSNEKDAFEIAERIRKKVKKKSMAANSKTAITISLGCANMAQSDIVNIDNLISMADKALYYAKEHGRDQSKCFSDLDPVIS